MKNGAGLPAELDRLCERSDRLRQYRDEWRSPRSRAILDELVLIARHREPVLILGPTGSGKTNLAKCIHEIRRTAADERTRAFVQLNMAAISPTLALSELFGYARGSFTGATEAYSGLIRSANGGTLFLDEVADADPGTQAALLGFLDDLRFRPLGATREESVDLDLVSATNKVPETEIGAGTLREDLYYRLAKVVLEVPPLGERAEDIPGIARSLVAHLADRYQKWGDLRAREINDEAVGRLVDFGQAWSGNVRQLEFVLTGAFVRAGSRRTIGADDLPPRETWVRNTRTVDRRDGRWLLEEHLGSLSHDELMKEYVRALLARSGGVKRAAARTAKVASSTFHRWVQTWLEAKSGGGEG